VVFKISLIKDFGTSEILSENSEFMVVFFYKEVEDEIAIERV
jgi:hypothetical protein